MTSSSPTAPFRDATTNDGAPAAAAAASPGAPSNKLGKATAKVEPESIGRDAAPARERKVGEKAASFINKTLDGFKALIEELELEKETLIRECTEANKRAAVAEKKCAAAVQDCEGPQANLEALKNEKAKLESKRERDVGAAQDAARAQKEKKEEAKKSLTQLKFDNFEPKNELRQAEKRIRQLEEYCEARQGDLFSMYLLIRDCRDFRESQGDAPKQGYDRGYEGDLAASRDFIKSHWNLGFVQTPRNNHYFAPRHAIPALCAFLGYDVPSMYH
ncbi:hypothetical protein H9P43_007585 [Blastocladiella emersonii ATCC 22665]|nr:hypothetical protein H9P43_007585 [Blastocladiella emersonii ATCC 22665]